MPFGNFGAPYPLTEKFRTQTWSDEEMEALERLQLELIELQLRLKTLQRQRENIKFIAGEVNHRFELRRAQCDDLESRCDAIEGQAN